MEQQIKLVDEMIAENPDATCRDFIELLKDIESIESASKIRLPTRFQSRDNSGRFAFNVWIV
jgi:hypothetical protein